MDDDGHSKGLSDWSTCRSGQEDETGRKSSDKGRLMVVGENGTEWMGKGLTEMNVKVWRTRESGRQ